MKRFVAMAREQGLVATLRYAMLWPARRLRRRRILNAISSSADLENRFTAIYTHNLWGDSESASGKGSNLLHTAVLRARLPELLRDHAIDKVFDAPCGDFHWMREVVANTGIKYVGGDIVKPLVERLSVEHSTERASFIHLDLTQNRFPAADLMICRDCLFHLSFSDCLSVLRNFISAGIPLLLTTTHELRPGQANQDIATGDFRPIDLHKPPFGFTTNVLARVDDWIPPDPRRFMCLWNREQVCHAVALLEAHVRAAAA